MSEEREGSCIHFPLQQPKCVLPLYQMEQQQYFASSHAANISRD